MKRGMIRLSIIVPFYNVEQYIEECICSLYDQDIPQEEYEVICVDDCSPDGSRAIVERLQKEYKTLRLICHERNKKLGGARNTGLREAKGEYVWFVDSDDYIEKNCLQILLHAAEVKDVETILFDYQIVYKTGRELAEHPTIKPKVCTGEELLEQIGDRWPIIIPSAWNKLYKRVFLIENSLFFVDDVMYEDTDWTFRLLYAAKRVSYMEEVAYNYRKNASSITAERPTPEKMVYTVLQQSRCVAVAKETEGTLIAKVIEEYVNAQLTVLRRWIKSMNDQQKRKYVRLIRKENVSCLKAYSTWRTWLAIRYGITCFVN